MYLARLKGELRKRDARVTGKNWELFHQARTAESHTCRTHMIVYVSHVSC